MLSHKFRYKWWRFNGIKIDFIFHFWQLKWMGKNTKMIFNVKNIKFSLFFIISLPPSFNWKCFFNLPSWVSSFIQSLDDVFHHSKFFSLHRAFFLINFKNDWMALLFCIILWENCHFYKFKLIWFKFKEDEDLKPKVKDRLLNFFNA